jgi:elongator complex protein 1
MRLYADFLSTNNKNKEAALAYEYLNDHASAWPCYRSANLWREALSSAILADVSADELSTIATDLADGLAESKDYLSASSITLDYLSDLPSAARLLCRGCHFAEAIRIVTLRREPALITEVIDPGLVERSADMTEFLADMKGQLQAQVPRLKELRTKKAEDPMAFYEGMIDGPADTNIPDNISLAPTDTTSGGTFMTRYTNQTGTVNTTTTRKTSKNKRREERKRARGKKGTVYEEEYLTNSIERLIERINTMQEEIQRLVEGLVRRGMRERADAVSNAVNEVMERCQDVIKEMYPPAATGSPEGVNGAPIGVEGEAMKPTGGDATLWDSLQEVGRKREAPVVKMFERLSLLG